MLPKPEIVVYIRVRSYKRHGNHLHSELISASLPRNCFSDLGDLGWKESAHLFTNRQHRLRHQSGAGVEHTKMV